MATIGTAGPVSGIVFPLPVDYAKMCQRIYLTDEGWTHYWELGDIVCGHQLTGGVDYLVFRGSVTLVDWMRDINALAVWHPKLGFVHAGFAQGLDSLYAVIAPLMGRNIVILGHSLGAARACDVAGLFAYDAAAAGVACPVKMLCTFGQPKPGFANLARIITKSGMTHVSYRNRNDPVPLVPLSFWPFLDYVHTEAWIALDAAPAIDNLEPLRDHHINLYIQGLTPVTISEVIPAGVP
jgi:hypothetical protein